MNAPLRNPLSDSSTREDLVRVLLRATSKVAPLWPLDRFVAVNPFLGLSHLDFRAAASTLARVAGARMTMQRSFYADAIRTGRIRDEDLAEALIEARGQEAPEDVPRCVATLRAAALEESLPQAGFPPPVPTVASVASELTGKDWERFVSDRVADWAASYFGERIAIWISPWQALTPYAAWWQEASLDRTPEVAGLAGFRERVKALPSEPLDAATAALGILGVASAEVDDYLHRLLMTMSGWAGYARSLSWDRQLRGGQDARLVELLIVRLVWEALLLEGFAARGITQAWARAWQRFGQEGGGAAHEGASNIELLLHMAYERAWQRELAADLARKSLPTSERRATPQPASDGRRSLQAAFCIDVRSEVFRRALESVAEDVETLGFAGFFGFPFEYVPLGDTRGLPQCPPLLAPSFVLGEGLEDACANDQVRALNRRARRQRSARAWSTFKGAAIASFGFVESVGLGFAYQLVSSTLGRRSPSSARAKDGGAGERLAPLLASREQDGRLFGMTAEQRLATARGVLRAMSLTEDFARLVLLVGHGSTTVNNPHAHGLDCGACGGQGGAPNARVAAAVLNDPEVRAGLAASGIEVPEDAVFLGCLHDTTTDEVTILDEHKVPPSHHADLARVHEQLRLAGERARRERARGLGVAHAKSVDAAIFERSSDWSQVRPEWGLAGCGALIVAPRSRTRGVDLRGRSFLHSYDWRKDEGFAVLELIMTAPMVVVSWIGLQYFASTVDNRVLGSGNKTLHNVVGTLGVLEGGGGDLRVGLPLQSVHDGQRFVHEPLRPSVLIEAPVEAINGVIARQPSVQQLLDNGWLHLFALDESGRVAQRYRGQLRWSSPFSGENNLAA